MVIGGFVAIIAVSNVHVSAPVKAAALDTPASRNAKRTADLNQLHTALVTYLSSHTALPYVLPKTATQICAVATTECKKVKMVDLNYLVTTDTGLASIPDDPIGGPGYGGDGYTVMMGSDGAIVFGAPRAESGQVIEVKK